MKSRPPLCRPLKHSMTWLCICSRNRTLIAPEESVCNQFGCYAILKEERERASTRFENFKDLSQHFPECTWGEEQHFTGQKRPDFHKIVLSIRLRSPLEKCEFWGFSTDVSIPSKRTRRVWVTNCRWPPWATLGEPLKSRLWVLWQHLTKCSLCRHFQALSISALQREAAWGEAGFWVTSGSLSPRIVFGSFFA